jgi:NAD(P)-dependent dehydrogenase (short-subunit alcohol dehydrogenase family)
MSDQSPMNDRSSSDDPFSRRLSGKRALITGASRGLGRAMALRFAAEGARVAISYARDAKAAEATLAACGAEALGFQVSVLDVAGTTAMVAALEEKWGGIDVLVNNAGVSQALPLALMEEEDWDRVLDVNLKGAFLTTRAVVRGMVRRKAGVVLSIGSLAGERMIDAPIHYCASKAALRGFTEALAKEMARYKIRALCLAPGILEDGVAKHLSEPRLRDYLQHCALGRVGTLDEVARFAAFLVSDACPYMSGATVVMDGGV